MEEGGVGREQKSRIHCKGRMVVLIVLSQSQCMRLPWQRKGLLEEDSQMNLLPEPLGEGEGGVLCWQPQTQPRSGAPASLLLPMLHTIKKNQEKECCSSWLRFVPFLDPERHFPAKSETQPELFGALPAPACLLPWVFCGGILVTNLCFGVSFPFLLPKILGSLIL